MSIGRGTLNDISVLIVGSGPGAFGSVFRFGRLAPSDGGTRLFRLKLIKAFLTGKIPGDYRVRSPRMLR